VAATVILIALGPSTAAHAQEKTPSNFPAQHYALGLEAGPEPLRRSRETSAERLFAAVRQCLARSDAPCAWKALAQTSESSLMQSAEYLDLEAETLALQHRDKEALTAIDRAIKKEPQNGRYLIVKGTIYQKSGDQVSAIRSFLYARRLEPRSPSPFYHIGMSFFTLAYYTGAPKYYDRADQNFRAALELDPKYARAEFMLGVVAAVNAQPNEAKTYLRKAIEMSPHNPIYRLYYGILLRQLGDDPGALREMTQADELDPSLALVHYNLGGLYSHMGKLKQARKQLETAVRLNPSLSAAYYQLGAVYRQLGMSTESKQAFKHFQEASARDKELNPIDHILSNPKPGVTPTRHQVLGQ
jgi:tetratricopeptide (TPR) repeat protein